MSNRVGMSGLRKIKLGNQPLTWGTNARRILAMYRSKIQTHLSDYNQKGNLIIDGGTKPCFESDRIAS
jgi:hypothetical protein